MNPRFESKLLCQKLQTARNILVNGIGPAGRHRTMFDSSVLSLAHGDGTRRPHPQVISSGIASLLDPYNTPLDDYKFLQQNKNLEQEIYNSFMQLGVPRRLAQNICIDSGTTRLFINFLQCTSKPRSLFLVSSSFYHPLPAWCDLFGANLLCIQTKSQNSFKLTPDDIDSWFCKHKKHTKDVQAIFLFNPTQTGALYTSLELKRLARKTEELGLGVIEDCIFMGTEYEGKQGESIGKYLKSDKTNTLIIQGVSKSYNLPNIRIGWCCGSKELIMKMKRFTFLTAPTIPGIAQNMALSALRSKQYYLRQNSSEMQVRAAIVSTACEEINHRLVAKLGARPNPFLSVGHQPDAGHAILISFDGLIGMRLRDMKINNSFDLCSWLLKYAKVAVSPGDSLGLNGCKCRIAFGSVGLNTTYGATFSHEIAAAKSIISSFNSVQVSQSEFANFDDSDYQQVHEKAFSAGRAILLNAFIDRIGPALEKGLQL